MSSSLDKRNTPVPASFISANDPRITNPTFQFFQNGFAGINSTTALNVANPITPWANPSQNFHFHAGCNVNINNYHHSPKKVYETAPPSIKRRRLIIYSSSESSPEE